jgi:hypothetical protein
MFPCPDTVKLGLREVKHNPKIPMLSRYTIGLPSAPPTVNWGYNVPTWGMMLNDRLGDCTCAALGHAVQLWSYKATGTEITPSDNEVENAYEQWCGYNPANPSSDEGGVESDILTGVLNKPNALFGQTLEGFAAFRPIIQTSMMDAIWLFGLSYLGFMLPISVQGQEQWLVPASGLNGPGAPGSWGGHAIVAVAYEPRGIWVVSWGKLIFVSWDFVTNYCVEGYALYVSLWANSAPNEFNAAQLKADMSLLN